MKQLIVLTAILPLLLLFVMQAGMDQKNHNRISIIKHEVELAKEQAKLDGCFTPLTKEKLRNRLAECLDIEASSIEINATGSVQHRLNYFDTADKRGLIHYEIKVPIDSLMAGTKLLGIDPETNKGYYLVSGSMASEKLPESLP